MNEIIHWREIIAMWQVGIPVVYGMIYTIGDYWRFINMRRIFLNKSWIFSFMQLLYNYNIISYDYILYIFPMCNHAFDGCVHNSAVFHLLMIL